MFDTTGMSNEYFFSSAVSLVVFFWCMSLSFTASVISPYVTQCISFSLALSLFFSLSWSVVSQPLNDLIPHYFRLFCWWKLGKFIQSSCWKVCFFAWEAYCGPILLIGCWQWPPYSAIDLTSAEFHTVGTTLYLKKDYEDDQKDHVAVYLLSSIHFSNLCDYSFILDLCVLASLAYLIVKESDQI